MSDIHPLRDLFSIQLMQTNSQKGSYIYTLQLRAWNMLTKTYNQNIQRNYWLETLSPETINPPPHSSLTNSNENRWQQIFNFHMIFHIGQHALRLRLERTRKIENRKLAEKLLHHICHKITNKATHCSSENLQKILLFVLNLNSEWQCLEEDTIFLQM